MFLAKINNTYAFKNKLEKEVYELLKSCDRAILDNIDVDLFCAKIESKIEALNSIHNRCKSIRASFKIYGDDKDIHLSLEGKVCNFVLYYGERRDF